MNEKNVEALALSLAAMHPSPFHGSIALRVVAEFLASRGCLGPASEVLDYTERSNLAVEVANSRGHGLSAHSSRVAESIERIAKGEARK